MKYDKYELLELFESEPEVIDDEFSGMYSYQHSDAYGFTLQLYFSDYEQFCSLSLSYKDFKIFIFELGFEKIESIQCKEDKLIIQQEANPKNIVVYFKPNYALVLEERTCRT